MRILFRCIVRPERADAPLQYSAGGLNNIDLSSVSKATVGRPLPYPRRVLADLLGSQVAETSPGAAPHPGANTTILFNLRPGNKSFLSGKSSQAHSLLGSLPDEQVSNALVSNFFVEIGWVYNVSGASFRSPSHPLIDFIYAGRSSPNLSHRMRRTLDQSSQRERTPDRPRPSLPPLSPPPTNTFRRPGSPSTSASSPGPAPPSTPPHRSSPSPTSPKRIYKPFPSSGRTQRTRRSKRVDGAPSLNCVLCRRFASSSGTSDLRRILHLIRVMESRSSFGLGAFGFSRFFLGEAELIRLGAELRFVFANLWDCTSLDRIRIRCRGMILDCLFRVAH